MKKETVFCDNCKDECEFYIELDNIKVHAATGKGLYVTTGFLDVTLKDKSFCSVDCFYNYLNKRHEFLKNKLFVPGDQVGHPRANNRTCNK